MSRAMRFEDHPLFWEVVEEIGEPLRAGGYRDITVHAATIARWTMPFDFRRVERYRFAEAVRAVLQAVSCLEGEVVRRRGMLRAVEGGAR